MDRETVIKGLEKWIDDPLVQNTEIEPQLVHDALELLKEQVDWIALKDQQPTEPGTYLICAIENGVLPRVSIAKYSRHFYMTGRMAYWVVTHWMPLPNPPEDVSKYLLR